jgi:hypothetical protein
MMAFQPVMRIGRAKPLKKVFGCLKTSAFRMAGMNPKGIPAQSPRLRGTSYLGKPSVRATTPNGVAAWWQNFDATLVGVENHLNLNPG